MQEGEAKPETEPEIKPEAANASGWARLAWFVGIWIASVLALAAVGGVIRWGLGI